MNYLERIQIPPETLANLSSLGIIPLLHGILEREILLKLGRIMMRPHLRHRHDAANSIVHFYTSNRPILPRCPVAHDHKRIRIPRREVKRLELRREPVAGPVARFNEQADVGTILDGELGGFVQPSVLFGSRAAPPIFEAGSVEAEGEDEGVVVGEDEE